MKSKSSKTANRAVISEQTARRAERAQNERRGVKPADQDPKRRLGNFQGAGEPARKGGRTAGIVGQTKQQNHNKGKNK